MKLFGVAVFFMLFFVVSARAQFADHVRKIGGKDYTFIDYSYNNALSNPATHNHSVLGRLFVPEDYDASKSYDLVMALHGDGAAGNRAGYNNTAQIRSNFDNLVVNAENQNFLVYIPQAPFTFWSTQQLTVAQAAFAKTVQEFNVDPNRIYVAGLSKGGVGVQEVMSSPFLNQGFGAYVPLSVANAAIDTDEAVGRPAWYFVGRQDGFLGSSRGAVSSLANAQGGSKPNYPATNDPDYFFESGSLRYTEYRNGGHNNTVWSNGAYNDANLYEWLFSHESAFGGLAQGQSLGINFAGKEFATTTDSAGNIWNTVGRYGSQRTEDFALGFGYDADGDKTTISLAVSKAFDKRESKVPDGITAFDDPSVAGRYWMTANNDSAVLTLYGLTPGGEYNLDIFASTTVAGAVGLYEVGDVSAVLDATGNLDEFAQLTGLIAGLDGELVLTVTPHGGANRAVINALVITTAIPEPASLALLLFGSAWALLLARSISRRSCVADVADVAVWARRRRARRGGSDNPTARPPGL